MNDTTNVRPTGAVRLPRGGSALARWVEESTTEEHFLRQDRCLFVCNDAGNIPLARRRMGFYYRGLCVLSGLRWKIEGQNLRPLASSSEQNFKCDAWLTSASVTLPDGSFLPSRLLTIHRSIVLWQGLQERLELRNCAGRRIAFQLDLELASDYLDMMEIRGLHRRRRGRYLPVEYAEGQGRFAYEGVDRVRRVTDIAFEPLPDDVQTGDIEFDDAANRVAVFGELFDTRWESETNPEGSYRSATDLDEAALPPSDPMTLVARWNVEIDAGERWRVAWRAAPWEHLPAAHSSYAYAHERADARASDAE